MTRLFLRRAFSAILALAAALLVAALLGVRGGAPGAPEPTGLQAGSGAEADSGRTLRLLAVGDVNLGRTLGQTLLRGDTLYPWRLVADTLAAYDVVFANLESNLSDQGGRTEDPHSNTVFTGPPCGAASLRRGGVSVVSTANNHAMDFGPGAVRQTLALLDAAGVAHAGTALDSSALYDPLWLRVRGFRLALFACTELMNDGRDGRWKRYVASADTARLLARIREARRSADVIVVSLHAGDEYAPRAAQRVLSFARAAADAGADLVLGHHPHVPYAIERRGRAVIAPSLGNFVFKQPFQYWTQRSFALAVEFARDSSGTGIRTVRCLPVRADYQPAFLGPGRDYEAVLQRVSNDGNVHITHE